MYRAKIGEKTKGERKKNMKKTAILIFLLFIITTGYLLANQNFVVNAASEWNVVLTASKEGYSDASDFGVRSDATDGFDPAYDEVDPPAPPVGVVSYFWYPTNPTSPVNLQKLSRSKIPPSQLMTWTCKLKPVAIDGTMTISWTVSDVATVPLTYNMNLKDSGGNVLADMRKVTEYSFAAEADTTYTFIIAVVEIPPVQYELTISVVGSGTTDLAPGSYKYNEGEEVSVDAIPDLGWKLDHWELDGVNVGDADPYTVTMDADHALTAFFVEIPPVQYQLTISVVGSGTTDPAPGSYKYNEGTEVTVDAIPDLGWKLDHWELDGINVGDADPYKVTMDSDHALTAFFVEIPPIQYQLTISVVGSGTTDPAPGSYKYNEGTDVSVDAIPDLGWKLDYWELDGLNVGDTDPYTVTMDADHTLTAFFVEIPPVQYELTISVVGSGTTNPAPGSHMYNEGEQVSVDAIPDPGWKLDHWELDGVNVGDADPYKVTMDADHTLTAVFVEIPPVKYQLTIGIVGSGTTDPAPGSYTYDEGTEVKVEAIPDLDWKLDHWELDGINVGTTDPTTVVMNKDHKLIAVFVKKPPPPVGGLEAPFNTLAMLAPWILLALAASFGAVVAAKRKIKH